MLLNSTLLPLKIASPLLKTHSGNRPQDTSPNRIRLKLRVCASSEIIFTPLDLHEPTQANPFSLNLSQGCQCPKPRASGPLGSGLCSPLLSPLLLPFTHSYLAHMGLLLSASVPSHMLFPLPLHPSLYSPAANALLTLKTQFKPHLMPPGRLLAPLSAHRGQLWHF